MAWTSLIDHPEKHGKRFLKEHNKQLGENFDEWNQKEKEEN